MNQFEVAATTVTTKNATYMDDLHCITCKKYDEPCPRGPVSSKTPLSLVNGCEEYDPKAIERDPFLICETCKNNESDCIPDDGMHCKNYIQVDGPFDWEPYSEHDMVNHPNHYCQGGIECIKAIEASMTPEGFQDYCKGNVLKYIWRWRDKAGVQDLEKALVYLNWLIESAKNGAINNG